MQYTKSRDCVVLEGRFVSRAGKGCVGSAASSFCTGGRAATKLQTPKRILCALHLWGEFIYNVLKYEKCTRQKAFIVWCILDWAVHRVVFADTLQSTVFAVCRILSVVYSVCCVQCVESASDGPVWELLCCLLHHSSPYSSQSCFLHYTTSWTQAPLHLATIILCPFKPHNPFF